ncbi:MAG: PAS domain S-box protein [Spirochaetes bacterium]|nr:PAS domain S-box protein [Spirochaetota bacterium]
MTLLFATSLFATPLFTIDDDFQTHGLCPGIEYYEDRTGSLTVSDIEKKTVGWDRMEKDQIALGFTESAWWFRFSVRNTTTRQRTILLKIDNALFDYVDLYSYSDGTLLASTITGDQRPLESRDVPSNYFVFRLNLSPGVQSYLFRIQTTSSLKFNPVLLTMVENARSEARDLSMIWFLAGWLIILILYNGFLFISTRRKDYLLFVSLVFSLLLLRLTTMGFSARYLLPPALNNIGVTLIILITILSCSYFLQSYFSTRNAYPKFHRLLAWSVNYPIIAVILLSYFIPYRYIVITSNIYGVIMPLLFFLLTIYTLIKRNRQGYFLFAGFAIILIIMIIDGLYLFGLITRPPVFDWFYNTGLAWLMLFSSLGLADQLNIMSRELRKRGHIIESASSAIATADLDGVMTSVNPSFLQMWGFEENGEIIGKSFPDFWIVEEDMGRFVRELQHTGKWTGELRARRKDGSLFDVQVSAAMVFDSHGRPDGFMLSSVDITEKKRAEVMLRTSLSEKETLLKELHHRVKNNLGVIYSLLKFEIDNQAKKDINDVLTSIQNRIRSMALVHQRLYRSDNLSSIGFSQYCADLIHYMSDFYHGGERIGFTQHTRDIELDIETVMPLGLIMTELIGNSLKHGFPGDRVGEIVVDFKYDDDYNCELTVSDTGIGLPHDFKLEDTESMGMFIIRALVEQLSGSIQITGEKGVSFIISFPLKSKKAEKGK